MASSQIVNMAVVDYASGERTAVSALTGRPVRSFTDRQLRQRARRAKKRGLVDPQIIDLLYKPVEEWDYEELAHGRPRDINDQFRGRAPAWVTREVYEASQARFVDMTKQEMGVYASEALKMVLKLLQSEETDENGKWLVPASVKADMSKFLIEHVVGKPKQRIEQDISVKLQAVLAQAIVSPGQLPAMNAIEAEIWEAEQVEDV